MDWSAAGAPLVVTRAVHFTATAIMVGSVIFRAVVWTPTLRSDPTAAVAFRGRMLLITWLGLAVAVISGAAWLLLQTASMSGMPLEEALTAGMLSTVINETQFGEVTIVRAAFAIGVAVFLVLDRTAIARWLGFAAALAFAASLAWTGHAGAAIGAKGNLLLAADALHVIAAAAWIGGLVALRLFLVIAHRNNAISLARDVVRRFSTLGIVSVAIILLSGVINATVLVGSLHGLVGTEYGRVLTLKVAMFAVMLVFAAINRFRLTPLLAPTRNDQPSNALRQLIRSCGIETAFGFGILVIVAWLGTLHPAIHHDLATKSDYPSATPEKVAEQRAREQCCQRQRAGRLPVESPATTRPSERARVPSP